MVRRLIFLASFIIVSLGANLFAQGCSQCRLLAEQGAELEESSFGTNINYGILYLMIIPYILLFLLFRKRLLKFFRKG